LKQLILKNRVKFEGEQLKKLKKIDWRKRKVGDGKGREWERERGVLRVQLSPDLGPNFIFGLDS
jgi:hypothetical protein